jgi:ketosteroid isomerase-like protein
MNSHSHPVIRRILAGAFVVLVALGFPVMRATAATDAAVHEDLRKLKSTYEDAINGGNLSALEPLFEAGSTGVTVDNQPFKSVAELKGIYDRFHASFPGVVYRIKLNPEPSVILGDVAVAYGTGEEYVKTADGEFTYTSSFTAVLHRDAQGQWKLVRSQVSMDPFRNSVVQFFVSRTKLYFGGGALLAGLIGGFIFGRLSAGKKSPVT